MLSDPAGIETSFRTVWQACYPENINEEQSVPKAKLLEVFSRVVSEFERNNETEAAARGFDPSTDGDEPLGRRTMLQLNHVFSMVDETVKREEAKQIFRTVLLSLQASIAMREGKRHIEWLPLPPSSPGYGGSDIVGHSNGPLGGGFARVRTHMEDVPLGRTKSFHPGMVPAPQAVKALPSRHELEEESRQLANMSQILNANLLEEHSYVQAMEEEFRHSEASGQRWVASSTTAASPSVFGGRSTGSGESGRRTPTSMISANNKSDSALLTSLEGKVGYAELEVAQLEAHLRAQDREMTDIEFEASEHEHVVNNLGIAYMEEMNETKAITAEAFEIQKDYDYFTRCCAQVEQDLFTQEARARTLRQTYEGQRMRCTDVEAEVREAKQQTSNALEGRLEAEAKVERHEFFLQRARHERAEAHWQLEEQSSVLTMELAEIQARRMRAHALLSADDEDPETPDVNAEAAMEALRRELASAAHTRDREVATAHATAHEVSELEIARARLQGQLATHEGELRAARRRSTHGGNAGGGESRPRTGTSSPQDLVGNGHGILASPERVELMRCTTMLRHVQHKTAEARLREYEFEEQLRLSRSEAEAAGPSFDSDGGSANQTEMAEAEAEQSWRSARQLASELGQARAAFQRHHTLMKASPVNSGDMVLLALVTAAQEAQHREKASAEKVEIARAEALATKDRWRKAISGCNDGQARQPLSRAPSAGATATATRGQRLDERQSRGSDMLQRLQRPVRSSANSPVLNTAPLQPSSAGGSIVFPSQPQQQQQQQALSQQPQPAVGRAGRTSSGVTPRAVPRTMGLGRQNQSGSPPQKATPVITPGKSTPVATPGAHTPSLRSPLLRKLSPGGR